MLQDEYKFTKHLNSYSQYGALTCFLSNEYESNGGMEKLLIDECCRISSMLTL